MPDLLWFKWMRSKEGYSIREDTPTVSQRREHRRRIEMKKANLSEEADEIHLSVSGRRWNDESFMNREFEYTYLRLWPNGQEIEEYEPLKSYSGLYKEFANLKDSPEEYLRFANDYGFLIGSQHEIWSECLADWLSSRNSMKYMIKEWEECSNNESLGKFIERYSERPGGIGSTSLILRKSFEKTRLSLYISPRNLANAMKLQFFQVISSNLQIQRCAVCPKWFTFGAGTGRRKSAHYCSDRCRKTAWLASQNKSKK